VLDIQWCPHDDNIIASASEDNTVKVRARRRTRSKPHTLFIILDSIAIANNRGSKTVVLIVITAVSEYTPFYQKMGGEVAQNNFVF
jgi:WD40 repeat protein